MSHDWLSTEETAHRLGVKPQTVYAYVSRGLLTRRTAADGRRSEFADAEVERLAMRTRHGGRSAALEIVIETEITLLDTAGHLYYRGRDASELARFRTFEQVAALLWDADQPRVPWEAPPAAIRACQAAQSGLPDTARPADRLRVIAAALGTTDPLRYDLQPAVVRAAGRTLIAALVDALPARTEPRDRTIAARLWSRLATRPPISAQLRTLDAALILLADHELSTSTFAARVAASAWADPYLVVLSGLGTLGGALRGAHAGAVEAFLAAIPDAAAAPAILRDRLRTDGRLPGFGGGVYRDRDPRADTLLALLSRGADPERLEVVQTVLNLAARQDQPAPTTDFALGALATCTGLTPGAAETVFCLARTAGLIAHAMEEYSHRLRFRSRAAYTGRAPQLAATPLPSGHAWLT